MIIISKYVFSPRNKRFCSKYIILIWKIIKKKIVSNDLGAFRKYILSICCKTEFIISKIMNKTIKLLVCVNSWKISIISYMYTCWYFSKDTNHLLIQFYQLYGYQWKPINNKFVAIKTEMYLRLTVTWLDKFDTNNSKYCSTFILYQK